MEQLPRLQQAAIDAPKYTTLTSPPVVPITAGGTPATASSVLKAAPPSAQSHPTRPQVARRPHRRPIVRLPISLFTSVDAAAKQRGHTDADNAFTIARDEHDINELLEKADADFAAMRLTMPPGDNAWDRYKAVLVLDPDNTSAREGIRRLVSRYVELAKRADVSGKSELASRYLRSARSVLFGVRERG